MKYWIVRAAVILGAGALAALVFALKPALTPDTAIPAGKSPVAPLTQAGELNRSFAVDYQLDLQNPPGLTRFVGDIDPEAFSLLHEAKWNISLQTKDGQLTVKADAPVLHAKDALSYVQASYDVDIPSLSRVKMPDGSYHLVYQVNLVAGVCIHPSFWGKGMNTIAVQTLQVDVENGSVDYGNPQVPLKSIIGCRTRLSCQGVTDILPTRASGSPAEIGLTDMLYNLGMIDTEKLAKQAAEALPTAARHLYERHADATKPWPECWGEAAPMAKAYAKRLAPTLLYLQEHECFGSKELADFINSDAFSHLFGESFADVPVDAPEDRMAPFPITEVPEITD